ncbi:MAG: small ribosomal subunit Rsm22 family protein [Candidatus Binataceae bacterium]
MVQERIGVPSALRRAIEEETKAQPAELLLRGASELGRNYRDPALGLSPKIVSDMQRLAYLVTRIPAIFQVNQTVDSELRHLCPDLAIASLLDLGCGPGTATLAAMQTFEQLNDATLADRDAEWLKVGRRLIDSIDPHFAFRSRFAVVDLLAPSELGAHDLVVISYALGELSPSRTLAVVDWAWSLARRAIVMIEPGTPHGFATILAARDVLIGAGASIVAPCTHAGRCPIKAGDWCHFDTRVERDQLHRRVKSGTLPYEVEKFSYLVAARQPAPAGPPAARIIRHPLKKSGHVILDLCTAQSTAERLIVSRRNKEAYRQARAAKWGDRWIKPTRETT